MKRIIVWLNLLIKKNKKMKRWQRIVTVMAAIITFVTTYALILPAITVEREAVDDVGGMYLEEAVDPVGQMEDTPEEDALIPVSVQIAADKDNAVTFLYEDEEMSAVAVFASDEKIPEDAVLVVNPVDQESEMYADLGGRAAKLLDGEHITDVTTCAFYDFALVCDGVDVTPKSGLADIRIYFYNNSVEHYDDVIYGGKFGLKKESEEEIASADAGEENASVKEEEEDLVMVSADQQAVGVAYEDEVGIEEELVGAEEELVEAEEEYVGAEEEPEAGKDAAYDEDETAPVPVDNVVLLPGDGLFTENADKSSVAELSDGIITTLSIKGFDLAENDSVAGLFAGTVEKDTADAMSEDEPVVLNAGGEDYTVKVTCDAGSGVTKEASLEVSEITSKDERYQGYLEETKKAMGLSEEEQLPYFAARFFDIKIMVGGEEFKPESGVTVEIAYAEELAEDKQMEVNALHFTEGTTKPDVIDANVTEISEDGTSNVEFTAESFSVYGVVYTVDFHWEVNGKTYKFNIPGGGYVSFEKLLQMIGVAESDVQKANSESAEEDDAEDADAEETLTLEDIQVSEATKRFAAEVNYVVFSDPELVWVSKVDEDITVGNLKENNKLEVQYSAELTEEQIEKINAQTVKAGDWALISMKPFTSEESLTVTMKDGDVFTVRVTDAVNDAIIITNPDNTHSAQTIGNPSGTTIDLFDYWINNNTRYSDRQGGWPDFGTWYNYNTSTNQFVTYNTNTRLYGRGNNAGINQGHVFKFNPAHGGTVIDGTLNTVADNGGPGVNSWTQGATPRTYMENGEYAGGLVQNTLEDGYPKLSVNSSLGTDGESLAYLFNDKDITKTGENYQGYKQKYGGVNNLLYVDPNGYYTFDSHDFNASYNNQTKTFSLQPQTEYLNCSEDYTGAARGFWPFGQQIFWHGMHLQTDFSMPADGEVLSPRGEYNPMEFEFQGDDDTWLYVDGLLIGDGGGVHNQTLIRINFKDGSVLVSGEYDHKDDYVTDYHVELWLDELYQDAGIYDQFEWVESCIDETTGKQHYTFAPNSEHHFDMFYLERGGGESNLRIHYNLISTTQFSAHKSLVNSDSRLQRNQFQFELIGFDNPAYADQGELVHPVMPTNGVKTYTPDEKPPRFDSERTDLVAHTTLVTGVTEDGNVNFGDIPGNISNAYIGKEYYYMLREIVPDDAVRIVDPSVQPYEYVTWEDATDEQRLEGGFVKDGITYDAKVYYYKGTVEETAPNSGKYKIVRKRYMDPNYTIPDEDTKFHNFVNGLDPLTLKVVKTKPANDGDGEPIPGANFSLTRATMSEFELGTDGKISSSKWAPREGVKPYTGTTGNDGTISFPGLTEDYYILEETAAPAGYQRGETYRWLVKILKQESNGVVALVPVLVGLDADGNVIGNSTETLSVNNSTDTASYTVLNTPKEPIEISVQKEWQEADKEDIANLTGYSAEFTLKRLKSWVSTETVEGDPEPSSTLRIGRYSRDGGPWYFDNQTYTFVAGSEVTITYDYDDVHNGNWGNLQQYKIGTNGSPVPLGDNGYFNVTMPAAGQTTDVYFYDGFYQNPYWNDPDRNKFNALVSLTAVGREPQTTTTEVTTPHIDKPDNFSATVILSGENLSGTFVNPDTDDVKFPVIEVDPDTGITYTYKYYIEETGTTTPEGAGNFETIYIIDGKEMSEAEYLAHKEDDLLHDGGTQTVINRQLIDIPVEKRWPDYETHEEEGHEGEGHTYTWQAVLQIDYRDVPLDGSTPSSWREYHEDHPEYAGYSKTLTNEHLTDVFRDLPMYAMNSEGKECRREYSVVEKSYLVRDENGNVVASLEVVDDTEIVYPPGRKYTLWYQHDAGEDSNYGDEVYPNEEDYSIMVYNLHENREIVKEITADITKTWPEGFSTENARAKFVLKRNVLVEYRNYENIVNDCPRSQWVWVKLVTGDGKDQMLQVPPGRQMFIRGNIKDDGDFKKIIFTDIDGVTHIAQQDTSASFGGYKLFQVPFTAPQTSSGYTSQSNPFVIVLTGGEDDAVGGINGFILSDSNDRQFIGPDQTFSREFELSDEMGWSKHFPEPAPTPEPGSETDPQDEFEHHLPSIEVSKLDEEGNTANTYIYTYYFEEVECEPESFYATFTDSTGKELLGDQDHQFYFGTNINAVNRPIGFDISKIDKDKNTKKLGGATFSIRKLKGNPPVISGQGGTIDTDPSIAFEPAETAEETGKASFSGLSPGFYEVKEDEPPTGYILTEDLVFYIKVDESGDVKLMNKAVDSDTGVVTWTEAQTGQWNGDVSYSIKNSVNGKTIVYSVRNKPGATLPHTGGSGSHIFKLLGFVLTAIAGAGFVLLRKVRRYTK